MYNTIVTGNTGQNNTQDVNGTLLAESHNLFGSANGNNLVNGVNNDIQSSSPGLGPLPEQRRHQLHRGSPGRQSPHRRRQFHRWHGSEPPRGTDGRLGNRVVNGVIDIGAVEYQPPITTTILSVSANTVTAGADLA